MGRHTDQYGPKSGAPSAVRIAAPASPAEGGASHAGARTLCGSSRTGRHRIRSSDERECAVAIDDLRELEGGWRCGAIRYTVRDAFLYAANCHCSGCRTATASAFKPFAGIERSKLRKHC